MAKRQAGGTKRKVERKRAAARLPRRSQQQRRTDTQAAILNAAMTVLVEDGYEKFTATRVAQTAGVSRGAQENYFRTKNELIVAATRYTLGRAADEARAFAARNAGSTDPVDAFLENSRSFYFSATYVALMEMVTVARRNPALAKANTPVVRDFRKAVDSIWIDALQAAGYERASVAAVVRITHFILRGMAFASAFQPRKSEYPDLLEAWRAMVRRELKRR